MPRWAANLLKLIEAVILGTGIVFLCFGNAGGIYEIAKGGPSDGFLFGIMMYGFPLIIAGLCCLPVAIYLSPTFRNVSRCLFVILIGMGLVEGALNQHRIASNRHSSLPLEAPQQQPM